MASSSSSQQGDLSVEPKQIDHGDHHHHHWIIRPTSLDDAGPCHELLRLSFETFLSNNYSSACLAQCLPLITTARGTLLTCGTYFVAIHPTTQQIVACGGWTPRPHTSGGRTSNNDKSESSESSSSCSSSPRETLPVLVPHLRHFATHPSLARQGIAWALWQHCCRTIQEQMGALQLPEMEVFSTLTAEPFFRSCGFVTVQWLEVEMEKDLFFPCLLMRRPAEGRGTASGTA